MTAHGENLKRLTESILNGDEAEAVEAVVLAAQLFRIVSGFRRELSNGFGNLTLGSGRALTSFAAAACMDDPIRTIQFIRGLRAAVSGLLSEGKKTVSVCEVGAGPFSPLVISVASTFSPDQVQFSSVDLESGNLKNIERCVSAFSLDAHFLGTRAVDATYGRYFPGNPDVFVVECMDAAGFGESQAAIQLNLTKTFPQALILPERIRIDYASPTSTGILVDWHQELIRSRLTSTVVPSQQRTVKSPPVRLSRGRLVLETEVNVFGEHIIPKGTSAITRPIEIDIPPHLDGRTCTFNYEMGTSPHDVKWVCLDD